MWQDLESWDLKHISLLLLLLLCLSDWLTSLGILRASFNFGWGKRKREFAFLIKIYFVLEQNKNITSKFFQD